MGDVIIDQKPERPTLELLDDMVRQVCEALVLDVLHDVGRSDAPAVLTDERRGELLGDFEDRLVRTRRILGDLVRQGASLGEGALLAELDRMGVERDLLSLAAGRRRR